MNDPRVEFMIDPHIESLIYRLETEETLVFEDAPPLEKKSAHLRLQLADDLLTVWPKDHYASEAEARGAVEQYLRAWEASEAIRRHGQRKMHFVFKYSRFIDRSPLPDAPRAVRVAAPLKGLLSDEAVGTLIARERRYPEPPEDFVASPEVEFMLERYELYLRGREPLLPMAYACVTRLEYGVRHAQGGGTWQQKAAREYGVSTQVLRTLHRLSTVLGDEVGARKFVEGSEHRPATDQERRWIDRCLLTLMRRAGERAADQHNTLATITMDDLPPL